MPEYKYTGPYEALYPDVRDVDGRSLTAIPGAVYTFDVPPNDGQWAAAEEPPAESFTDTTPKKKA